MLAGPLSHSNKYASGLERSAVGPSSFPLIPPTVIRAVLLPGCSFPPFDRRSLPYRPDTPYSTTYNIHFIIHLPHYPNHAGREGSFGVEEAGNKERGRAKADWVLENGEDDRKGQFWCVYALRKWLDRSDMLFVNKGESRLHDTFARVNMQQSRSCQSMLS